MPKIKSKLPANINTNISTVVKSKITTPITSSTSLSQVAPVASSSIITHSIDSSSSSSPRFDPLLDEILVSPGQYLNDEENSLINNPPYKLTLSLQELLSPARKFRKIKNKSQDKIPRPQNAWVLFRKDYEANQRMKFPDKSLKMKNVSTDAGEVWRNQSTNSKRYFEALSKLAHEKHKILYPNYKYAPKKKTSKENVSKSWIFRDGSVVKQSYVLPTAESHVNNHVNDDDSGSSAAVTVVPLMNDNNDNISEEFESSSSSSPSYLSSSSPESLNSSIIINSPASPFSPVDTPNDLGLYISSVTSILTYSGETLASSSSSSSYYNYQQNVAISNDSLSSNLNDLKFTNSDYETYQHLMMNLSDTCPTTTNTNTTNDDEIHDIVDENFWQFSSTLSDSVNSQEGPIFLSAAPTNTFDFLMYDPIDSSIFENTYNNNNNNHTYYFGAL